MNKNDSVYAYGVCVSENVNWKMALILKCSHLKFPQTLFTHQSVNKWLMLSPN